MTTSETPVSTVPPAPRSGAEPREAGPLQGILLLIGSCMPVLGSVLLAPIWPAIRDHFTAQVGAETAATLAPIAVTLPFLPIALLAPFIGAFIDRVGRKQVLVWSLLLYGIVATAPLYLDNLYAILGTRLLVGVAEAAIMTACTTLLGDYYSGKKRDRYLGLQVVVTSLSATVLFGVAGAMGNSNWRTPFWLYAIAFVLLVFMQIFLYQPKRQHDPAAEAAAAGENVRPSWGKLAVPVGLTLITGLLFYVVPVELPAVLEAVHGKTPSEIGLFNALAALATAIGGITAPMLARRRVALLLPIYYAIAAVGLLMLGLTDTVGGTVSGAVIASVGVGLALPTLLIWTMGHLDFEWRGRGTGAWTSMFFLGQFLCPVFVNTYAGNQPQRILDAITLLGWVSVAMVVISLAIGLTMGRRVAPAQAR